jgi:hypothetical protein
MEAKGMETIIIAALVGIIVGGGASAGVAVAVSNSKEKVIAEAAAVAGTKAAKDVVQDLTRPASNLTEPDLLTVACSAEYLEKNGDMLCREMFCRMQTRGMDAKTSQIECEAISNVMNKREMMKSCDPMPELRRKECYQLFDERI